MGQTRMWNCRDCQRLHPGFFKGCPISLKPRSQAEDRHGTNFFRKDEAPQLPLSRKVCSEEPAIEASDRPLTLHARTWTCRSCGRCFVKKG